jgi:hypothetical protein
VGKIAVIADIAGIARDREEQRQNPNADQHGVGKIAGIADIAGIANDREEQRQNPTADQHGRCTAFCPTVPNTVECPVESARRAGS